MIGPIGLDIPIRKEVEIREAILLYGDENLVSDEEESAILEEIEDMVGLIETVVASTGQIVCQGEEMLIVEWDD